MIANNLNLNTFNSVTEILKQLSLKTDVVIEKISDTNKILVDGFKSITSLIKTLNTINLGGTINSVLQSFSGFSMFKNKEKPENNNNTNFTNINNVDNGNSLNITTVLSNIHETLKKLTDFILNQKNGSKSFKSSAKDISVGINSLKKTLNKRFLESFEYFVIIYERFINGENTKKLAFVQLKLGAFSTIIAMIGFFIGEAASAFNSLTLSIWLLTISLILPPFQTGFVFLIGMLKLLKATIGSKREGVSFAIRIKQLAIGMMFFVGAMYLMGKVGFANGFKLLIFLTLLAGVQRLFRKKTETNTNINKQVSKKFGVSGIGSTFIGLGLGIAFIVMSLDLTSEMNWTKASSLIFFIGALGLTLWGLQQLTKIKAKGKKLSMSGNGPLDSMLNLSIGLSILLLAIEFISYVDWSKTLNIIVFIFAIGVALATSQLIIGLGGRKKSGKMSGMLGFATGIAILLLAIDAAAYIDWKYALLIVGFIAAINAILVISNKLGGAKTSGMFGFAMGIGVLLLTLLFVEYIDWITVGFFIASLAAIIFVTKTLQTKNVLLLGLFAIVLLVLGIALVSFNAIDVDYSRLLYIGASIALMIGISFLAGKLGFSILFGSIILLLVSTSFLLTATALRIISSFKINMENILILMLSIGIIALGAVLLGSIAPAALIGAFTLLALSGVVLLIAFSFKLIENLTFENIGAFILGVSFLVLGLITLLPMATIALASAALLIVIGISSILLAGTMAAISELIINENSIKSFTKGIDILVNGLNELSLITLGKVTAKSVLLLPIVTLATISAALLSAVGELKINEKSINNFVKLIDVLTTNIAETIANNVDKLKAARPGIKALAELINVSSNLADIVRAFANLTFTEYTIKNDKIVPLKVHQIKDAEILKAGDNIALLLNCLINPLMEISSNKKEWLIGKTKVKNPFKGGFFGTDNNSGVNRIKKIGEAYLPLAEFIKNISSLGDKNSNISENFATSFANVIDSFANTEKWGNIESNIDRLNRGLKETKNILNSISVEKCIALERNLKLLTESKYNGKLQEVLDKLQDLIDGILEISNLKIKQQPNNIAATPIGQNIILNNNNQQPKNSNIDGYNTNIVDKFDGSYIETLLEQINTLLGGKIKVEIVDNQSKFKLL